MKLCFTTSHVGVHLLKPLFKYICWCFFLVVTVKSSFEFVKNSIQSNNHLDIAEHTVQPGTLSSLTQY